MLRICVKNIKTFFSNLCYHLSSLFFSGFLTLLPITLTITIFRLIFRLLKNWLEPIRHWQPLLAKRFPYIENILTFLFEKVPFFEIFIAICIIVLVGLFVKFMLLRTIIGSIELLLLKIPVVRSIYAGVKQLTSALDPNNEQVFQKVVLTEFPRAGCYSVGFLTGTIQKGLAPNNTEEFFGIYVPTTPNPTTGFYLIMTKKDFIITDLTRQEATTIIISGGIIQPERFFK
jgi:uncharacterized membrane protein